MNMVRLLPLRGAHGRDYKYKAAIVKDWREGKDFLAINGQYCSVRDFPSDMPIAVRYAECKKVAIFTASTGQ